MPEDYFELSTASLTKFEPMDVDGLLAIIEQLSVPHPVAVWFVDKPIIYQWITGPLPGIDHKKLPGIDHKKLLATGLFGIPLINFVTRDATDKEFERAPYFKYLPGVWIEMSDGSHKEILIRRPKPGDLPSMRLDGLDLYE